MQVQGGADLPVDTAQCSRNPFSSEQRWAKASIKTQDWGACGHRWWSFWQTGICETGAGTNWDVMPEFQVTLSKRQHVRFDVGLRHSRNQHERPTDAGGVLSSLGLAGWKASRGLEMTIRVCVLMTAGRWLRWRGQKKTSQPTFQTSDRCIACHNELTTRIGTRMSRSASTGGPASWPTPRAIRTGRRASGAKRIDHPEANAHIEDECSVCHMPITRYEAKLRGKSGQIFAHLPFDRR